jgi:hypothetical protein
MRTTTFALSLTALVALCAITLPARADTDLAGGLLVGSGVDTGDGDNNPYQLQLGGWVELVVDDFILGFKGTRSLGSDADCSKSSSSCHDVEDLRSLGGDLGYEWDLALLHIGPRLGMGTVREVHSGDRAFYLDPGAVLDVELGPFLGGVDVRYRVAVNDSNFSGLLVFARLGLRF